MKKLFIFLSIAILSSTASAQDSLKVLCIGNSFTYVFKTDSMLKRICNSNGHPTAVKSSYAGGMSFKRHLVSDKTIKAIERHDNNVVMLQDRSMAEAYYAHEPKRWEHALKDAQEIATRIRANSADARIILERTWSYGKDNYRGFGSYEEFDRNLVVGTRLYLKAMNKALKKLGMKPMDCISPIGDAFAIVRAERPDIVLLRSDNHHQSEFGAYLKACVNYIIIYGGTFSPATATCDLDPQTCKYLQDVAIRAVNQAQGK